MFCEGGSGSEGYLGCRAAHPGSPCVKIRSAINENMDGRKHSGKVASEAEGRGTGTRPQAPPQPLGAACDATSGACGSGRRAFVRAGPPPGTPFAPSPPPEGTKTSESSNILPSVKRSATTPIDRHHCTFISAEPVLHWSGPRVRRCPCPAPRGRGETSAGFISLLPQVRDFQASSQIQPMKSTGKRLEAGRREGGGTSPFLSPPWAAFWSQGPRGSSCLSE